MDLITPTKKAGKIILLIAFLVIFGVSLYCNFLYYKNYKAELQKASSEELDISNQPQYQKIISGSVDVINEDKIVIKELDSGSSKEIMLDKETKFAKTFADLKTLEIAAVDIKLTDIKSKMSVNIFVANTSNFKNTVAAKIEVTIQNYVSGIVESINETEIVIKVPNAGDPMKQNDEFRNINIKLADNVIFYQAKNQIDMSLVKQESNVTVVFDDDYIANPNQKAIGIMLLDE